ncbi:hypothetical protein DIURU_002560 [Diutina rugosa]|uniref:Mitochondrial inner membrane i-AAA protease complex subunit MGR1 n=1 Tax=Diutina rugosa TaxID=5481 RepID=A0A642UQ35_DIURU|nr:uncharacterized protein DIURU_002560 [Diutina rugosa]KAA8903132.1 hypothetical protein DIURU_002560 [Diutina rugosa]
MGVYIPPPDDSAPRSSRPSSGSSSSSSDDDKTIIRIAIPRNPSVGLVWGPLTPASDNRAAVAGAIALQLAIGIWGFSKARHIYRSARYYHQSRPKSALKASVPFLAGSVLVFGSGLEMARMALPYDPWYDEARHWRRVAERHGQQPSAWFGAYDLYTPMPFKQWTEMVNQWLKVKERQIAQGDGASAGGDVGPARPQVLRQLHPPGKYQDLYQGIHDANTKRYGELLANELKDVNELNKAERIDLILEGKSPWVNPHYTKPHIQLGTFRMDSIEDFELAWDNFNPWEELKLETDCDIRLIPRWKWTDDPSDSADNSEANSDVKDATDATAGEAHPSTVDTARH